MPTLTGHILGHYVPKDFIEKFKDNVPHSVLLKDAAARLYEVVNECSGELKELFSDKKFLKSLESNAETVQDKDSGYRTMAAFFANKTAKEKARKDLRIMASRLSVDLDHEIHAYQVASAMFYLYIDKRIEVDL